MQDDDITRIKHMQDAKPPDTRVYRYTNFQQWKLVLK